MDKDIVLGIIRLAYDFWLSTSRKSVKYRGFWFESGYQLESQVLSHANKRTRVIARAITAAN